MESSNGGEIDWISMLPKDVVCKILSGLPTKHAVGTSVLSKTWQQMWASIPVLNFDDSLYFNESRNRCPNWITMDADLRFMSFVESIITGSQVSCFESFCLELHYVNDDIRVNSWIRLILERNVRKMELRYFTNLHIRLPSELFENETLVVLILKHGVLVEVPTNVSLPNLKVLHLDSIMMNYSNVNSDDKLRLFSGCPVLEELYLNIWAGDCRSSHEVSIPSLKRLRIGREMRDFFDCTIFELEINAPKLEYLEVHDIVTVELYMENLSSLIEARLNAGRSILQSLFEAIRNVKVLSLSATTAGGYCSEDKFDWFPMFNNLIVLEIGASGDMGWNMLAGLLEKAPNLEVLKLLRGHYFGVSEDPWDGPPPSKVPNLLLHLKETKIEAFNGRKYEIEAIEFILKNAKVLETMTINCRTRRVKKAILKKLAGFPRASKSCQLDLLT